MKKKLILTVIFGTIITFLIYKQLYHETISIVALGDGLATGETAYNVTGYSFNDYLRDYYEKNSIVEEYIKEFAIKNETSETFKTKLNNNFTLESTNTKIQQAIAQAKIVTIAIGMDELNQTKPNTKNIEKYLNNMEKILKVIRIYNDKRIFLLSLYPTSDESKDTIKEVNNKLRNICSEENITFIDIEDIPSKKEYFFNEKSYYLNYKGQRYISELIINQL